MSFRYTGAATLVSPIGVEVPCTVSLSSWMSGYLKTWGGSGVAEGHELLPGPYKKLRLPDGREGDVLLTRCEVGSEGIAFTFTGNGKPEFMGAAVAVAAAAGGYSALESSASWLSTVEQSASAALGAYGALSGLAGGNWAMAALEAICLVLAFVVARRTRRR